MTEGCSTAAPFAGCGGLGTSGNVFALQPLEVVMLHKTSYMRGFHIHATDGQIGHVDDFLVDENWNVRFVVVDTSNFIGGRHVLISPSVLERVNSPDKEIRVRLTRDEIKASPSIATADIELIETVPPVIII